MGDEWVYNDPDHKFGANVRVYYNPNTNYETVKEILVVSNNGKTTGNDSIPNSDEPNDSWNRSSTAHYWEDGFELTPETVRTLNCAELQDSVKYMTRRTILNLFGSPAGHTSDNTPTDIWEFTSESDSDKAVTTVIITFDDESGAIPEMCHVLPAGDTIEYISY